MIPLVCEGSEPVIVRKSREVVVQNDFGSFHLSSYQVFCDDRTELHGVLRTSSLEGTVPVRLNSACFTSEVLRDKRCDCAWQISEALQKFSRWQKGVLIYHFAHEGRGLGLMGKIACYQLMDQGHNAEDAAATLGLPIDSRRFDSSAVILADLRVKRVKLLTENPRKIAALSAAGIEVAETEQLTNPDPDLAGYYEEKRRLFGL
ncbi:MAG: GTP cyclohydrolase II [Propionibacteriaceae bacterium]|jgi:GTP cyclohydrolase II|nr:GTP cyclohydrolase II [Propionibacteriaceae bacterium]